MQLTSHNTYHVYLNVPFLNSHAGSVTSHSLHSFIRVLHRHNRFRANRIDRVHTIMNSSLRITQGQGVPPRHFARTGHNASVKTSRYISAIHQRAIRRVIRHILVPLRVLRVTNFSVLMPRTNHLRLLLRHGMMTSNKRHHLVRVRVIQGVALHHRVRRLITQTTSRHRIIHTDVSRRINSRPATLLIIKTS